LGQVLWEFLPGILKFLAFIGIITILIVGGQAFLQATDTLEEYTFEPDLVREDTPIFGSDQSGLVLVEASDYQCSACAAYYPTITEIKDEYSDRLQFAYKYYPIEGLHPYAEEAAEAGQAAYLQGYFREFSELAYTEQDLFRTEGAEALEIWASRIEGLDIDQWNQDRNSPAVRQHVRFAERDIDEINLPSTPTSRGESKPSGQGTGTPTTILMRGDKVVDWWGGAVDGETIRNVLDTHLND
jgi:hypothetical protein